MLFSVIVPTFNRVHFLHRALASVWAQRFTDFEAIVVDDGSTDGTGEYLRTLENKTRVVSQPNLGPGAARNNGALQAQGEYVAFLDSDDVWFPWTLNAFAEAISKYNQPEVLGGSFVEFVHQVELEKVHEEPHQSLWFPDYLASSQYPYYVGSGTCVLRRKTLLSIKFLEDRLNGEDHDLILRMGTHSGFARILEPTTLGWRRHPASETADLDRMVSGTSRLVERERSGAYPGGAARARERRRILTRHTRAVTMGCLQHGLRRDAWKLYQSTLPWNIALGRTKYLAGFPLLAFFSRYLGVPPRPSS